MASAMGLRSGLYGGRYGQRRPVESFFSARKRKLGSALSSRNPAQFLKEATLGVVASAHHR